VTFHDTRTGAMLGEYRLKDFNNKILIAPRGRRAIAPLANRRWELLTAKDGKLNVIPIKADPLDGQEWSINPAFSPDSEKVFLSPGPGWLQEFSTSTGLPQPTFKFADNQQWSDVVMISVHPSGSHALVGTMQSTWSVDLKTKAALPIRHLPGAVFLGKGDMVAFQEGTRTHWSSWPEITPLGDIDGSFNLSHSGPLGDTASMVLGSAGYQQSLVVAAINGGGVGIKLDQVIGSDVRLGLAAVADTDVVRIIRLHDGEVLAEVPNLRATNACFSADGSRVGLVMLDSQRFVSLPLNMNRDTLRERAKMKVR
jgi:hypothetical protein